MHDVFSKPWVDAWADEIARSEEYRTAAARWEGPLALAAGDGASAVERAVVLDLWHGTCRDARVVDTRSEEVAADALEADFVLLAPMATWRRVMDGDLEPVFGIMSGQLKLARGQLAKLLPYVAASKELVAAASRVPTRFPGDA